RLPRPARDQRRLQAQVRQALRGAPRRDGRRGGGVRGGGAQPRLPRARARLRRGAGGDGAAQGDGRRPGARLNAAFTNTLPAMAGLSRLFAPREREFFDLFEEAGRNIVQSGEILENILDRWPDHGELAREIVICEQEGDRITHDIIQRLNSTFVTPIEREDILDLASA